MTLRKKNPREKIKSQLAARSTAAHKYDVALAVVTADGRPPGIRLNTSVPMLTSSHQESERDIWRGSLHRAIFLPCELTSLGILKRIIVTYQFDLVEKISMQLTDE